MPVVKRHSLRELAQIAFALIATLAALGQAEDAWAADASPQVTMRISPETAELSPEGVARVIVVVDNASAKRVTEVEVSIVVPAALSSKPKTIGPLTIRPGGAVASQFTLRQTSVGALPATALVRANYKVRAARRQAPLKQILVASLAVASHQADPLDHVAKVDVRSGLTALDDFHGGDVVLVVSNTSAGTVRVTDVRPQEKEGVVFELESFAKPKRVLAGHQVAIPVAVSLSRDAAVRSGEEALLFTVELAWGGGDAPRSGSVVVTHDVTLGVFGESDVAELLKIPSFIVLPGFLFIVTLALLWRVGAHFKRLPNEPILGNVTAFAYFIVVSSMLLILVYWLRTKRDLRGGYNFSDIIAVSRDAIVIAILVFVVGYAGHFAYLQWRFPTDRDRNSPITVLKKLGRQGLGLELHKVTIKEGAVKGKAFLYERRDREGVVRAVGPAIAVKYEVGGDAALHADVNRYRDAKDDPGGLAKRLEKARKVNQIRVRWLIPEQDGPKELTFVAAENVEVDDAKTMVVEEV
jgi:hypothetical protein